MELFGLLYLAFLLCVLVACIVVVFHLMRYSLDKKLAIWTSLAFVIVTAILVIVNVIFFSMIPFQDLATIPLY